MATEIVLTGTGVPLVSPDRAGPGTLVRRGSVTMQFDAGRGTVMRLTEAGVPLPQLTALFVTHHHSDHVVSLDDVAHTRWMHFGDALSVIAPRGPSTRFVDRLFERWDDDIAVRQEHTGRTDAPAVVLTGFAASSTPEQVWEHDEIRVSSVLVRHPPVVPSVAYRIDTPDGAVVVSGDTQVCEEVESLSRGAAVLVHEIARVRWLMERIAGTPWEVLLDYHAESIALGTMAERAGVPTLMLTHLVPPPFGPEALPGFVEDVREGGYTGEVVIGPDLTSVTL
jgi:ribonuclease Z